MKIDIVIGNPPYQEETGAGTVITGKKPIYQGFVLKSIEITKTGKVCLIIPSRWTMRGTGLEQLHDSLEMLEKHIRNITDYMNWQVPVFNKNIQIAGGVMYFLIDKRYNGKCEYRNIDKTSETKLKRKLIFKPAFIRNNELVSICHKVQELKEDTLRDLCRTNTFGLESYQRGDITGELNLLTSSDWFRIQRENVVTGIDLLDKYKLAVSGTTPGGGVPGKDGSYKVLGKVIELTKEDICTSTYIVIGKFNTKEEMRNLRLYLQTKFVRALIQSTISSMHIIPYSFTYVPIQNFNIMWTDETLYKKYNLTTNEVDYIERIIKTWD